MTAYRIGRVDGHWKNFLPPIRGGVFRKLAAHDCRDRACGTACTGASGDSENDSVQDSGYWSATDESEAEASSAQSEVQGADDAEAAGLRRRRVAGESASASNIPATTTPTSPRPKTRDEMVDELVQAGIDKGLAEYPSPDVETQRVVAEKFKALHKRVQNEGFYTCRYRNYAKEMVRYTLLFSLFIGFLRSGYYFTSAMFLGFFWQQIMFTAHDAGHRGITGKFIPDTLVGIFIADFCCGLSIGWWKSSHNVHHLVTNSPEHDPDTQNVPIFATCPSQFRDSHSSYYDFTYVWDKVGELMVPYQKYTYYPVLYTNSIQKFQFTACTHA
jgi:delta8-fatty-acid desaturase